MIEPQDAAAPSDQLLRQMFHVPTRNVSKAGLGFVAPPAFSPRKPSDATGLVRTDVVFRVGAKIKITLGPSTGKVPTVTAVITRLRPVHLGFFEVGVRFVTGD